MAELLSIGGPLLWLILVLGIIAFFIFLERNLQLHRARIDVKDFLQGIFNALNRGNVKEALVLCEDTPGPVARITAVAISRRDSRVEDLVRELDQAGRAEIARMQRRLSVLALLAQITPLLGLLGTVVGILASLIAYKNNIPLFQTEDVANGLIYGALTTAAGLIVAIPCHFGFNLLIVKIDRLVLDMRDAASESIHFLEHRVENKGA